MRILITTYDLTRRGGIQLFVSDLSRKLLAWGHEPIVLSPVLGVVADDLRAWTIPVTADLRTITVAPDVIIGNDDLSTMMALHAFPDAPAIFVCHGTHVLAPVFPRIRRYVAVDETCRIHLTSECGIDPRAIEVVLSSVDLDRFASRPSLPPRPRRAALFGNEFRENDPLRAVRAACEDAGFGIEIIGSGVGRIVEAPEKILPRFDLVFARARCALEAMGTGAAVVLMGPTRMGRLVTTADLDHYRLLNFGRRSLTTAIDVESVKREIARYDPADAGEVSRRVRATAALDLAAGQMVHLAEEVIDEQQVKGRQIDLEYAATASYLREIQAAFGRATRFGRLRSRIARWPIIGGLASRAAGHVFRALGR